MLDLHIHLLGHLDRKGTPDNIRMFFEQALDRDLLEIGFADHDYYLAEMKFDIIQQVAQNFPQLKVRLGIEIDYFPDREENIRQMLSQYPFDYVIGSVHHIGDWAFDMAEQRERHFLYDPDQLYREYFALITKAAKSGLFTTIGHFDLIKIFGVRPNTDVIKIADEALTAVKENGLALEINTNGRYKPVQEFYPEWKIVREAFSRGIPFTLGSDAHCPDVVGRDIKEVVNYLIHLGVKEVVGFSSREQVSYLLSP